MVWIKLPGLPKGMYTKSLLWFIGNAIGMVAKFDRNTNSTSKGQFSRIAAYVDLGKLLVLKMQINEKFQRMEYESLLFVCFKCQRFGHKSDLCPHESGEIETSKGILESGVGKVISMKE
ncbi:hypothetical protein PVK06_009205 [Gossypium arboreum]|uniref:CCHC-type domain-containing protein n=1 Tax=Gossypium arboreum TaxID=29729 RepID=A0ABR0QLU9_GOSAR|nr:hypothetical protein PVK06_009205 [Gossypium arboreum]